MNNIMKENLRELIVTAINQYNPEYVEQCDESELISSLVDSVAEFSKECEEPDERQEALKEIERINCRSLNFN